MTDKFSQFAQKSADMTAVLASARMIAALDVSVLLQGATGTGKSLLADAIVQSSPRAKEAYVRINCAALSAEKVEEQLFGVHAAGEFEPGYLHAAHNGTLLLDELAELPVSVQSQLLRFLEHGEVQSVGSNQLDKLNVRVIAASNADMLALTRSGRFRLDLFHRLNVVPIQLPSLQQRKDDLKQLLRDFSEQHAADFNLQKIKFSAAAIAVLQRYSWPGNVRELSNLCQRLTVLLPGRVIEPANIPAEIRDESKRGQFGVMDLVGKEVTLIQNALDEANGNKSRAARLLGISRDTLNYRLRKYGLV